MGACPAALERDDAGDESQMERDVWTRKSERT